MGDIVPLQESSVGPLTSPRHIAPMSPDALGHVYDLEEENLARPQLRILTSHLIHGGMYARTIFIPSLCRATGVLVKGPTILIFHGDVGVYIGTDTPLELTGYNVISASAGRKQAFVAHTDTCLTMIFPTDAKTIEDAERAFTDEFDLLASHKDTTANTITITGE